MIKLSERQMIVYRTIQDGMTRAEIKSKHKLSSSGVSQSLAKLEIKGLIRRHDDGQTFTVNDHTKAVYKANMGVCGEPLKLREGTISPDLHRELEKKYKTTPRSKLAKQFKIPKFTLNQWAIENGFNSKEELA
ncbi:LexA family protein [Paenibacillus sp. 1P03SA]|uniref:LexA family protein n=1 Tax=Paenibacillus sp. 1P03SA TaxID=3132294 RepID=UPI00399F612D